MSDDLNELILKIAGQVVMSPEPGRALRAWRESLNIRQARLASNMGVSQSVLSDYENGRRGSPGVVFVKKYVEALVNIDRLQDRRLERMVKPTDTSAIIAMADFRSPVEARTVLRLVKGELLAGEELLDYKLFGYTILDSIKAIYALSGYQFYRIFGSSTERVLVFTGVGLGRSPLVAIRVSHLKPRMVVIHGPKTVDELAVRLAQKEKIILALSTFKSVDSFTKVLSSL